MSQINEMTALILKYLHDKHPGKYDDMTDQKLKMQPYHKLIWAWWQGQAYYRTNGNYERLEDATEGQRYISIMGENKTQYELVNGKYVQYQVVTKKDCKGFYGDRIPGTY